MLDPDPALVVRLLTKYSANLKKKKTYRIWLAGWVMFNNHFVMKMNSD